MNTHSGSLFQIRVHQQFPPLPQSANIRVESPAMKEQGYSDEFVPDLLDGYQQLVCGDDKINRKEEVDNRSYVEVVKGLLISEKQPIVLLLFCTSSCCHIMASTSICNI